MRSVRVYLEKKRTDKNGRSHIYLQFMRRDFYTGEKVKEKEWDDKKKQVKPQVIGAMEINRNINDRLEALRRIVRDLEYEKHDITVEAVRKRFELEYSSDTSPLWSYWDAWTKSKSSKLRDKTTSKYGTVKKHLKGYERYNKIELTLSSFSLSFFEDFRNYSWDVLDHLDNTVIKHITVIVAFLNWCIDNKIKVPTDYKKFKMKETGKEVVFLTEEELFKLWEFPVSSELQATKDKYLFACFTGLRFSDVQNLKPQLIKNDIINVSQIKTGQEAIIPLNKYSREILDRNNWQPFRNLSAKGSDKSLRSMCKRVGIDAPTRKITRQGKSVVETISPKHEVITFHTGRSTFIMYHLSKGISTEAIMKMTGHRDYQSFKRYVRVTEEMLRDVAKTVYG